MSVRLGLLSLSMIALTAQAGPQSAQKNAVQRAEAQDIEDAILHGDGNLNTLLNRAHHLGQEGLIALDLSEAVRRTGDVALQRNIATALAELGHANAEPGLLFLTGSDDGATRMSAARGLGRVKSQAGVPKLLALLNDKTLGVRREAARALGQLHASKAGAALMKAAQTEGEPDTREQMLIAVGLTGDKRQIPALERFLSESSESARFASAQALCTLGALKGMEFARKQLSSPDRYERQRGVLLFEGSRAKDAAPVLEPLLKDKDRTVQAVAARVLYQGGDEKKLDWLVLTSFQSNGDDKLPYEKELETLRLADDQRRAILAKAGIK
jgi:HEAT repeat protein